MIRVPRAKAGLRDWLFGAPGKRLLLEALFHVEGRVWSQAELASAAGMHPKGSVDEPLLALLQLGLVIQEDGRYRLRSDHDLAAPLRDLLLALQAVPNGDVSRPPG